MALVSAALFSSFIVTQNFPWLVSGTCGWRRIAPLPALHSVFLNKRLQQFRRWRWKCLQRTQASSASDPSALHRMLRFTSAENVFQAHKSASVPTLLAWFCRGAPRYETFPLLPCLPFAEPPVGFRGVFRGRMTKLPLLRFQSDNHLMTPLFSNPWWLSIQCFLFSLRSGCFICATMQAVFFSFSRSQLLMSEFLDE